jgi:uncharacterized membrane protein YdbT with pleckstrin-like domain
MKKLDPKSIWLFFVQNSLGFIFFSAIIFFSCVFPISIGFIEDSNSGSFSTIMFFSIVGFLVFALLIIGISYGFAILTYNNYLYELKPEGFYKESGVITKKYVTIPYERIQNVDINRNIFARILGLSDLHIQTAGMSFGYSNRGMLMPEGRVQGVSESEAMLIRDELIKRARVHNHQTGV